MVILGLGSNLGDREVQLKRALALLTRGSDPVLRRARLSRIYESPALMPPGAPSAWDLPFLNGAVAGDTDLTPARLLGRLQQIEVSLGRPVHERWSPRPIDIDILWWDGQEARHPDLTIPHPEILNRSFVLEPLRDLIPAGLIDGETIEVQARRRAEKAGAGEAVPSFAALRAVAFPALMGILNVTPDSFSDGGRYLDPSAAIAHARRLIEEGASILDVGAESTRPDGTPVDPGAEWRRLEPVLRGLRTLRDELKSSSRARPFRLSLDSRNPSTVRSALESGDVDILNDVTGFTSPGMLEAAEASGRPLVFMHSLSIPVVRGETLPEGCDPVERLTAWAEERLREFDRRGIERSRVTFDPGIGFGKSVSQNWSLLERIEEFHGLGLPLLVGHSRKSFLEAVTTRPSAERDRDTLEVSRNLATKGVEVLRVHDVRGHEALFQELASTLERGIDAARI